MKKIFFLATFGVAGFLSAKNGENLSLLTKTTKEITVSKKIEIKKSSFDLDSSSSEPDYKCYRKTADGYYIEVKCLDAINKL